MSQPGVPLERRWTYSFAGLRVRADRPIAGLRPAPARAPVDVDVRLGHRPPQADAPHRAGDLPWYVSRDRDDNGVPVLTVWERADGRYFDLVCCDGARFLVGRSGREVWATWPDTLPEEDVADHLSGLVLGFVLRLRGVTCLHASAVRVNGRAVAFLGPQGAGKSTTAAALARRGHAVLADDLVALSERDGGVWAYPAYPQLRLWPSSVSLLFGRPDVLPPLSPNWDKRRLDLEREGNRFQGDPLPLGAVYVLGARGEAATLPGLHGPSAREALMALVGNTYLGVMLDGPMRSRDFAFLSRLVARVPVRVLTPHQDPERLGALLDLVLQDLRAPVAPPTPSDQLVFPGVTTP